MTLKRLQIKNFQCHEDLRIKFDPRVTAIIGPSDCGKSSIIRGLKWIATNRPRGDGFIRIGSDQASASVWSDQGKVRRVKGKENKYEIDDRELKAVGSDVPEQVKNYLKIDEMNFQGQHESPFWFDLTSGEVAKRLNDIVDLGLIDEMMSKLSSRHRKAKSEVEIHEEQLKAARNEAESLVYVTDLDGDLSDVESLAEIKDKKDREASDLSSLVKSWTESRETLKALKQAAVDGEAVEEKGQRCCGLRSELEHLSELIECAVFYDGQRQREIPDLSNLESKKDQVDRLYEQADRLGSEIKTHGTMEKKLRSVRDELNDVESELKETMDGVCPMCGSELENDECLM